MAWIDDLPNEILLKIFSYLSIDDLSLSIRNVCTRWRMVSEDDEIWINLIYCPGANTPQEEIICMLENTPALRTFEYSGPYNVIEKLSECCRRLRGLQIPNIKLDATLLNLTMERLSDLCDLSIQISPTEEGLQLTRIIGQSETLICLNLFSSDSETATPGLLKPIADGCPKLIMLECGAFNCPMDEICYLLQCKKGQLFTYEHYGPVTTNFFTDISECTKLQRLSFIGVEIYGLLKEIPPITKLQNLKALEISGSRFPMVELVILTLFLNTLSHLSYIGICNTHGNIDAITNKIILKCPLLTHLDLEGNDELHCTGISNLSSCKMLKCLDVSGCIRLGTEAMKYVAEGCPQLEYLDVSRNPITDGMFGQILRCRTLKSLLMWDCDLSGINLRSISTHIDGLLYLYIGHECQIPDEVINELQQDMPILYIKQDSGSCDETEYYRTKTDVLSRYPF
jgi:Leucine-rich repeat (LRR) protein